VAARDPHFPSDGVFSFELQRAKAGVARRQDSSLKQSGYEVYRHLAEILKNNQY